MTPELDRPTPKFAAPKKSRWPLALLTLPYLGLCFPGLYARATPALFGFPFFYWYQFAWVLLTSCLLGVVYRVLREPEQTGGARQADVRPSLSTD